MKNSECTYKYVNRFLGEFNSILNKKVFIVSCDFAFYSGVKIILQCISDRWIDLCLGIC